MGGIAGAARTRFARLATQLAEGDDAKRPFRDGMGTSSLFIGKKMFGLLDGTGALVLKLPPTRVQELIAAKTGAGWQPGSGAPRKEYVTIGFECQAEWLGLARESRAYMGSKR